MFRASVRALAPALIASTILAMAFVVGVAGPANAATITVGPAGTYPTISDAVAAASPGDVISVAAGLYTENVDITTPVTLVGAGPSATTIIGPVTLDAASDISGFTLDGQASVPTTSAPYAPSTVHISPGGAGSDIHDNVLANGYQDIYAQGVIGTASAPTLIDDNTIRDFHADQGTGVWIAASSYVFVDGNTIVDGAPIDANSVAVNLVCGSSRIEISGNTISDVGNAVVDIASGTCSPSTAVSIDGNTISHTASSALYFGGNNLADIAVTRNAISNVGGTGAAILLSGSASWLATRGLRINGFGVSRNAVSSAPNGLIVSAGVQLGSDASLASSHNRYCSSGRPIANATTAGITIASVDDNFCSSRVGAGVVVKAPATGSSPATGPSTPEPKSTAVSATTTTTIDPDGLLAITGDGSTTSTPSAPTSTSGHDKAAPKVLTLVEQREAAGFPIWLGILLTILAALVIFFIVFFVIRRRDA